MASSPKLREGAEMRTFRLLVRGLAVGMFCSGAAAAQTIAITGARVYRVSAPPIENGSVILRDGRIAQVGAGLPCPAGAQCIDGAGRWVTPGIFNALTTLGVNEVGQVQATQDATARGERGVAAAFQAWRGFNPASPLLQVTRNDGVVVSGIVPGGNFVSGQAAVIDLSDGMLSDMMLRAPAAIVADIVTTGENRGRARGEVIGRMDVLLRDARLYAERRNDFERNAMRAMAAPAADLQALGRVLNRDIPLVLEADRASDILAALALARTHRVRLLIAGGAEAWRVAGDLARDSV
ncbi:MAG: hypothetical protein ACT4R6_10745, partial [Gemmatimonadaceae bacterium]